MTEPNKIMLSVLDCKRITNAFKNLKSYVDDCPVIIKEDAENAIQILDDVLSKYNYSAKDWNDYRCVLPPNNGLYLVTTTWDGLMILDYRGNKWVDVSDGEELTNSVTAFRELPQPYVNGED